jgi:hypothetical protein
MNTYTREDLEALNWASTLIEYRGAIELTPSRVNRLGSLVQRAKVGDEITVGHRTLIEWVSYELGQHKLVDGDQRGAILFDWLQEKLDLWYPVAYTRISLAH